MWGDKSVQPQKDPQFHEASRARELEMLEELQKVPKTRGHRRFGRELEIFYHFLSRCKVGPPDAKTGKCKWKWLGKPAVKDFGKPNALTLEMAREFAEKNEEVELAVDDINKFIDEGEVIEKSEKEKMKQRIEKQKNKILMKQLEVLRKKRLDKRWKKRTLKNRF